MPCDWHSPCHPLKTGPRRTCKPIEALMDILFLLIPLSVILVFFILGGLGWAIYKGQFEDVDAEGERILRED
jgi:cbb3-type cytochrome oxidase maturation protein